MEIKINKPVVFLFYTIFPGYFGVMGADETDCNNWKKDFTENGSKESVPFINQLDNTNELLKSWLGSRETCKTASKKVEECKEVFKSNYDTVKEVINKRCYHVKTMDCIDNHLHSLLITESRKVPVFKYGSNAKMVLQSFNKHIFSEKRYDPPPDFYHSVLLSKSDYQNLACLSMSYQKLPSRIKIEECGDSSFQSFHMFDSFAKLRLPIEVTEDFCMFMVNPNEYCQENRIKPILEVAKNFADYSDKEIMSNIDHLREYFDYGSNGTKEESERRHDKMKRTLQVCHKDEGELRARVDKYINFYSLIQCLDSKIKEKVMVYSSNFPFNIARNREEFEIYFEPGNTSLESVRKAGKEAVTDMCCAFQNLEENLSRATIEACQKNDLKFSNKKALIGHYVRVAVERLNCTEKYLKVKVAVNTAPSAPVISMLLTLYVTLYVMYLFLRPMKL